MAGKKQDKPSGFRPIEVDVRPDERFRPIEVGQAAPAADTKKAPTKPAAGTKED